jgi:hypothetical protein
MYILRYKALILKPDATRIKKEMLKKGVWG